MRRALLTIAALTALPAAAVAADRGRDPSDTRTGHQPHGGPANFDVRDDDRAARRPRARLDGQRRLKRSLGRGGALRIAPATGTPALVARRGAFLTGKRRGSARSIALGYLRENASAFGLDAGDLSALRAYSSYTTPRGLGHVELHQYHEGIPAFDNVVRLNVQAGRLVSVSGAAKPNLSVPSTKPRLSAVDAVRRALTDIGMRRPLRQLRQRGRSRATRLSNGDRANLVLFAGAEETRLAWSVTVGAGSGATYNSVIDAATGRVLKRTNLAVHAQVLAFDHLPAGTDGGGTLRSAPTTGVDPWVAGTLQRLRGNNAWVYSDENDDTYIGCDDQGCFAQAKVDPVASQDIAPSSGGGTPDATWNYPQVTDSGSGSHTCPATGCSWNRGPTLAAPFTAGANWQANRAQAATQLFYFVNNFHDHLQADTGIQFNNASGNFEESSDPGTVGGDAVRAQADDGASTSSVSFPDADHLNNANMITLPERDSEGDLEPYRAPQMQMYLFGGSAHDVNGADDAEIVYHEYTHGLSNRLVDPAGSGGLFNAQGGAMGEAWSDWYAADYLDEQGFDTDTPGVADLIAGEYENVPFRFQAIDCPVGSGDPACPGGGFTFGDFGNISSGGAEEHADGEIWSQTLWDLRRTLIAAHGPGPGIFRARALVTDAMRIAPAAPTFLDMRDAILTASSLSAFGDCERIWDVFAARGMGSGAQTSDPGDTSAVQSFADPGAAACTPGGPGTATPATGAVATSPRALAKATFKGFPRTIRVDRRGRFRLRFRGAARVDGDLALRSVNKVRVSARRRVTFANRSFKMPASGKASILIKLSKKSQKVLRRSRRMKMRLTVVLSNASGSSRASHTFTLRRR